MEVKLTCIQIYYLIYSKKNKRIQSDMKYRQIFDKI